MKTIDQDKLIEHIEQLYKVIKAQNKLLESQEKALEDRTNTPKIKIIKEYVKDTKHRDRCTKLLMKLKEDEYTKDEIIDNLTKENNELKFKLGCIRYVKGLSNE